MAADILAGNVSISGGNSWKKFLEAIKDQDFSVKVGVLGGRYSGRYGTNTQTPLALVGFILEYGSLKSPPRMPFRGTIKSKEGSWRAIFRKLITGNSRGVKGALTILGEKMAKDIQLAIKNNTLSPKDKPATIRAKEREGFFPANVTGLRTGEFMSAVESEVVDRILGK